MNFIHGREHLETGDVVVVISSHECNVLVTTDNEFEKYKSGQPFSYYGGHYKMFPTRIAVPHTGYWNVTLVLGGGAANISYSIRYIKQ